MNQILYGDSTTGQSRSIHTGGLFDKDLKYEDFLEREMLNPSKETEIQTEDRKNCDADKKCGKGHDDVKVGKDGGCDVSGGDTGQGHGDVKEEDSGGRCVSDADDTGQEYDDVREEDKGTDENEGGIPGQKRSDHVLKLCEEDEDSEFYDTDLDDVENSITKENPFGENDHIICRQRYLRACKKFGNVPPQQRIVQDLRKKCLSLANRSLGPAGVRPLCVALVDNLRVENLILSGCDIQDEGCVCVADVLMDNMVISRLNLSDNGITHLSCKALSFALVANRTLFHLNLSGNKLDKWAMTTLTSGLGRNSSLYSINLSRNLLCEECGPLLGTVLAENTRVEEIDLSWNQLRGKGAIGVLKALDTNSTLTTIHLAWNGLHYDGAVAVAKGLKKSKSLTYMDVSHNDINWDGAYEISKGLKVNDTLQVLKIGDNPLTTTGALDLMQAASSEKCRLRTLDLMNVAVIGETELISALIQRKRKFLFIHGGVVQTHDVLGQRKVREITPMERVISYMKTLGIRPVELLRAFDKNVMFQVSKKEFIRRLKSTGVKLYNYEMEALANTISSRSTEQSHEISYSKLIEEVNQQILSERNRKIAERKKRERTKAYHKRILDVKLPLEALSETEEDMTYSVPPSRASTHSDKTHFTSLQSAKTKHALSEISLPYIHKGNTSLTSAKSSSSKLSMCAPLGDSKKTKSGNKPPKRKLRRRKSSTGATSWMSKYSISS